MDLSALMDIRFLGGRGSILYSLLCPVPATRKAGCCAYG
ncbi:MAG: hypothetical protein JWQ56_3411 [Pseudarthrobacter sp.]|nr:hypothetical protein [Pseudarthrobacter sp.]